MHCTDESSCQYTWTKDLYLQSIEVFSKRIRRMIPLRTQHTIFFMNVWKTFRMFSEEKKHYQMEIYLFKLRTISRSAALLLWLVSDKVENPISFFDQSSKSEEKIWRKKGAGRNDCQAFKTLEDQVIQVMFSSFSNHLHNAGIYPKKEKIDNSPPSS